MKTYKPGMKLDGFWWVTNKIDGVQVIYSDGVPRSRASKPLYGLPRMPDGTYEVFMGNWEKTISHVHTHDSPPCDPDCLYMLEPYTDKRLDVMGFYDCGDREVQILFEYAIKQGHEGLVLISPDGIRYKVKPKETIDVAVIGTVPGRGKHFGRMGALLTTNGKVGTGFTDAERTLPWEPGEIIEVECMGLTPKGKLRHPRFKRRRIDK